MSTEKSGTFLVTHADDESAVLKDVDDGQVHPLSANPGVEEGDALDASLTPEPPMEVTWAIVDVEQRRSLRVEMSDEPPTALERELAGSQDVGEMTRTERAGTGEIHVFTLPETESDAAIDDAVSDVADDEGTLIRAARLGVDRVEIRAAEDVLSVRYMP